MADFISREAAIKALQPTHAPAINEVLASVLRRVPAADVAPVRHGRWEWDRRVEAYRCSSCKRHNADRTAYCPNCGADLREDTI